MISLGTGMFMWDRVERVTSRYGTVYLTNQNWFETSESQVNWHPESADSLIGKKVKISCKVLQARTAQHCGDLFLEIIPTTPEVGEVIVLGIGKLCTRKTEDSIGVSILPEDNREKYLFDPKILYRLIEQTVEIFIEETDEDEHSAPVYEEVDEDCVISLGDGNIQTKGKNKNKIIPEMEKIDDGLFLVHPVNCTGNKGKKFKAI
jgi:hypothetical protein